MHWIQTIRKHLELSQADLAHYLGLSVHMVISVENDRRQLPPNTLHAAITLFNVIRDGHTRGHAPASPLKKDFRYAHDKKRLHRQYCRKLDLCNHKLNNMQRTYASACRRLGAYHALIQSLLPAKHKEDRARLRWTQLKINETMYQAQANNPAAQHLLAAEIAGLKSMTQILEAPAEQT